jgi:type IV pilus assembly protein PilQ
MRMYSSRIICHALILIFLMAVSGCAKRLVATNDVNQFEAAGVASVQEIKVKDDASLVEILTNRPLTYTSYKTSEPPKIFIDLAQTEPGLVANPLEVASGNIKRVSLTRQDFGGGFLTRIEISLIKDVDFSVTTDPADRGKLLLTLVKPQESLTKAEGDRPAQGEVQAEEKIVNAQIKAEELPVTAEPVKMAPAPVAEAKEVAPEIKPEVKPEPTKVSMANAPQADFIETPTKNEAKKALKTETEKKAETAQQVKAISAITPLSDAIEISVNGGVDTFNTFKLTKPERLVLDILGAKSSMAANFVNINSLGIAKARIGITPEKVRIVFDAARERLPLYEVTKTDGGLRIRITEHPAEPAEKVVSEPPRETEKPATEARKPVKVGKGAVEAIDFKVMDGFSKIFIKLTGDCIPGKPVKTAKGLSLTIKNCQIPPKLQRAMDTRAFASPVLSVTPYQVKVAGVTETRIMLKMRASAPFTLNQDGDTLQWDIKNPELPQTPALISGMVKGKAAPDSPRMEEDLLAAPAKGAAPAELSTSIVSRPSTKKVYNGRKVTLEFSDADVRKIFQLIAEVSNLNFLIADDVSGTISIKLVNVPWDQALDVILDSKGLGMQREGNIVQIKPKAKMQSQADEEILAKKVKERGMELRTEVFEVNYAAVGDVVTQFNSLKSERGNVTSDARTNRVIIKDIATAIEDMRSLLKNLDSPEKQVMIEARIVEATANFTRDLGVQWGLHYADGSASVAGINRLDTGFGGQVSATPPTSGTSGPGAAIGMSFGKLTSNIQLDLRLSAAATADQIKIISTPRVVTLNNKAAKISQGQSIPYQTTSAEGTKTEFVEAALTLEVTPHITADGSISMKIKATNNSAGTGSPPPINKKEATTELLVKNGETTVIGGIYVDGETETDSGVPFLQDIPLLGWLFKSNTTTKNKNELLIFVTPKIVS